MAYRTQGLPGGLVTQSWQQTGPVATYPPPPQFPAGYSSQPVGAEYSTYYQQQGYYQQYPYPYQPSNYDAASYPQQNHGSAPPPADPTSGVVPPPPPSESADIPPPPPPETEVDAAPGTTSAPAPPAQPDAPASTVTVATAQTYEGAPQAYDSAQPQYQQYYNYNNYNYNYPGYSYSYPPQSQYAPQYSGWDQPQQTAYQQQGQTSDYQYSAAQQPQLQYPGYQQPQAADAPLSQQYSVQPQESQAKGQYGSVGQGTQPSYPGPPPLSNYPSTSQIAPPKSQSKWSQVPGLQIKEEPDVKNGQSKWSLVPGLQAKEEPVMKKEQQDNTANVSGTVKVTFIKPQGRKLSLQQPAYLQTGDHTVSQPAQPKSYAAAVASTNQNAAASQMGNRPPGFEAWVERCFALCKNDDHRKIMHAKLQLKVKDIQTSGRMWLVDWDKQPVVAPADSSSGSESDDGLLAPRHRGGGRKRGRWDHKHDREEWSQRPSQRRRDEQERSHSQSAKHQSAKAASASTAGARAVSALNNKLAADNKRAQQRRDRFAPVQHFSSQYRDLEPDDDDVEIDLGDITIKGTCTKLDKSYFRLTCAPSPEDVRPEPILEKALERMVRLHRCGEVKYLYACDQFKAMRQDLTVQRIRNNLAVRVYEAHARAALEYGDLAEYNQCQTQLSALYHSGQSGSQAELYAYMILYQTVHSRAGLNTALLNCIKHIPADLMKAPEVIHALQVRQAYMTDNFSSFFSLYASAPNLGRALLDVVAAKVRWNALNMFVRAYKTAVPVAFLAELLGFLPPPTTQGSGQACLLEGCASDFFPGRHAPGATETDGLDACLDWLLGHGALLEQGASEPALDVKASVGKLSLPEEPKVAHGDENLSLGDFLASAAQRAAALY